MPVRKTEAVKETFEYSYEELLGIIRQKIDQDFGSLSKFLKTPEFLACGFDGEPNTSSKMMTVLSLPAKGAIKKVKSFPTLALLYRGLMRVELTNKIVVKRSQVIVSSQILK